MVVSNEVIRETTEEKRNYGKHADQIEAPVVVPLSGVQVQANGSGQNGHAAPTQEGKQQTTSSEGCCGRRTIMPQEIAALNMAFKSMILGP